ncbi:hypothetical protein HBI38_177370 [Parastagonospora nodorum]|nr:hypothetical protein HBI41_173970 [Parastagonospora nodorum]KAH6281613.1 hypothetical protein HBI40_158960 [Parastagonospora nodorum]KAH6310090.1 hypothetical protein HBI38_177370 [Parastagonospora nodorum]
MTDSLRARTLINSSAVLYEQLAARPGLSAEVGNIDLDFVPGVAFISDVYMADSLRAAARTGLSAEVGNIDLDFVPGVAFIPDVYMADSLRARTPINLSAVLYEQAAARTGLSAEVGNISLRARTLINPSAVLYEQADARSGLSAEVSIMDLDFVPGVAFDAIGNVELTGDLLGNADRVNNNNNNVAPTSQFSLTALLNLRSLALKRPALSGSDLDCGPSLAKRIKTDEDRKKSTHCQGFNGGSNNMEELICVGKVKHTYVQAHTVPYPDPKKYLGNSAGNNRNNLNIMVTDLTGREFGRVDMKSLTRLCLLIDGAKLYCKRKWAYDIGKFYKGKNIYDFLTRIQAIDPRLTPGEPGSIYVLRSVDEIWADVADVFDTVVSKSDEVPTREPSSYIKTELYLHQKQALYFMLRDNGRKFYCLVITGEDTHCKQTIKKAYIILLERALLILFMT